MGASFQNDSALSQAAARGLEMPTVYRAATATVRVVGHVLFFLMLFVPTSYQSVKAGLLAVVLGGITLDALARGRLRLHSHVLIGAIAFASIGAFFVLRGLVLGAPGALLMLNVYVTWPLVYVVLVSGVARPEALDGLVRVVVVAANAIAAYSLTYVLWAAGYWPDALYYALDQGQAIGFYGSFVEFNLYAISSLLFLTPFLIAALFVFPKDGAPVSRPLLWISLVLNLVTVMLTGRRGLLVLLPLAPALALGYRSWLTPATKRESRRRVVGAIWGASAIGGVMAAAGAAAGLLTPVGFARMIATGFQFNSDPVAMSRRDQFVALISDWLEHPLLGSGHGAPATGIIRSVDTPWAYELSYVALLYHVGLAGLLAYGAGAAWIAVMSRRIARRGWSRAPGLVATLVGSTCFLVANATNPYLEKYDYIWVIFLPIAFINCHLVTESEPSHER